MGKPVDLVIKNMLKPQIKESVLQEAYIFRNLQLYFEDIIVGSEKVIPYTEGMGLKEFVGSDRTFDAVVRNLQIISEALK